MGWEQKPCSHGFASKSMYEQSACEWREPNGKYNNKHKAVRPDSLKSINFINRKGVDFHA